MVRSGAGGLVALLAGFLLSFMVLESALDPKGSHEETGFHRFLEYHRAGQKLLSLEVGRDLRSFWRSVEAQWHSWE